MDIFENLQRINEQEDYYRNNVEVTVDFKSPASGVSGLDDDYYVEAPDNIEIEFDIDVEYRSWGIKDIIVVPRGVIEFEVVLRSNLPDEEDKEEIIPVKVDFSNIETKINWIEGGGIAPAEILIILGGEKGNEVVEVEMDFYYWKP